MTLFVEATNRKSIIETSSLSFYFRESRNVNCDRIEGMFGCCDTESPRAEKKLTKWNFVFVEIEYPDIVGRNIPIRFKPCDSNILRTFQCVQNADFFERKLISCIDLNNSFELS